MTAATWRSTGTRWLKFNLVGGIGVGVQLLVLGTLRTGFQVDYLVATAWQLRQPLYTTSFGTRGSPGRTGQRSRGLCVLSNSI